MHKQALEEAIRQIARMVGPAIAKIIADYEAKLGETPPDAVDDPGTSDPQRDKDFTTHQGACGSALKHLEQLTDLIGWAAKQMGDLAVDGDRSLAEMAAFAEAEHARLREVRPIALPPPEPCSRGEAAP